MRYFLHIIEKHEALSCWAGHSDILFLFLNKTAEIITLALIHTNQSTHLPCKA